MEATVVETAGVEVCEASVRAVWGLEVARLAPLGTPPQLMAHLLEAPPPPLGVQAHQLAQLLEAPQPQQLAWVYFSSQEVVPVPFLFGSLPGVSRELGHRVALKRSAFFIVNCFYSVEAQLKRYWAPAQVHNIAFIIGELKVDIPEHQISG